MKVADLLTNITPEGAVASLVAGNQVHGWYNADVEFLSGLSAVAFFSETSEYAYSRGRLPYWDDDGEIVFHPLNRFEGDGIVLAKNQNYSTDGTTRGFNRLYYKPLKGINGYLTPSHKEYKYHFTLRDFWSPDHAAAGNDATGTMLPYGGYLWNEAVDGNQWGVLIGGTFYSNDYFFSFDLNNQLEANPENFPSTADLLAFLTTTDVSLTSELIYGFDVGYANLSATADTGEHFYEILLQANAYPNGGVMSDEIVSFPQQWSIPIYNSVRNTTFSLTISSLASIIQQITGVLGSGLSPGGTVNLTMPLLTTAQLNAFYDVSGSADLNADGTVSTADLLEFLTEFGQDAPPPSITGQNFDSVLAYHKGDYSFSFPFFTMSAPTTDETFSASSSVGEINFDQTAVAQYLDPVVPAGAFNTLYGENYDALLVFWRLWHYAENSFVAHTSPSYFTAITEFDMPVINRFWAQGEDFDDALTYMGGALGCVRYERFPTIEDSLFVLPALNSAFEGVTFAKGGDTIQNPPPYGTLHGNENVDFLALTEIAYTPEQLLAENCRIRVNVQGFVECASSDSPSVILFFRNKTQGTTDDSIVFDGDDYYGGSYVYFLGGVDMSVDFSLETDSSGNTVKRKTFDFTVDPYNIQPNSIDTDSVHIAARNLGVYQVQIERRFSIGGIPFFDQAKRVVTTGVSYTFVNTRNI